MWLRDFLSKDLPKCRVCVCNQLFINCYMWPEGPWQRLAAALAGSSGVLPAHILSQIEMIDPSRVPLSPSPQKIPPDIEIWRQISVKTPRTTRSYLVVVHLVWFPNTMRITVGFPNLMHDDEVRSRLSANFRQNTLYHEVALRGRPSGLVS